MAPHALLRCDACVCITPCGDTTRCARTPTDEACVGAPPAGQAPAPSRGTHNEARSSCASQCFDARPGGDGGRVHRHRARCACGRTGGLSSYDRAVRAPRVRGSRHDARGVAHAVERKGGGGAVQRTGTACSGDEVPPEPPDRAFTGEAARPAEGRGADAPPWQDRRRHLHRQGPVRTPADRASLLVEAVLVYALAQPAAVQLLTVGAARPLQRLRGARGSRDRRGSRRRARDDGRDGDGPADALLRDRRTPRPSRGGAGARRAARRWGPTWSPLSRWACPCSPRRRTSSSGFEIPVLTRLGRCPGASRERASRSPRG
jgi:hypothetical protein